MTMGDLVAGGPPPVSGQKDTEHDAPPSKPFLGRPPMRKPHTTDEEPLTHRVPFGRLRPVLVAPFPHRKEIIDGITEALEALDEMTEDTHHPENTQDPTTTTRSHGP